MASGGIIENILEIRLFGGIAALTEGRALALPPSKKARALLGYLAAAPQAHSRQALCDLLWDGPDDPRAALRWSLSKLRPIVDAGGVKRLHADAAEVRLDAAALTVDLSSVRALVARGLGQASIESLKQSVGLCRGELLEALELPDCYRFHEWCVGEREGARALRLSVLTTLVERLSDRPEEALVYARQRVAIDPLTEPGHVAVIQLLGKLGRPREALEQYDSCRRILETTYGTRPSAAMEQARHALRVTLPGPAPESAQSPPAAPAPKSFALVGRADELAELKRRAQSLTQPTPPQVLLIEGDAGIGKSRLLDELADQVRSMGGQVVLGRAFESERLRPFGAWIDALRSWKSLSVPETLKADLHPILPELGGAPATQADPGRLFDAVSALLRSTLARGPLAVLVDDAHWLDEASVGLFHYVARELEEPQVLFACAARGGELADNAPALRLVRTLARAGRLERLEVRRLDATATAALAQLVNPGADAAHVVAESDGNPLFAIELARAQGSAVPDSLDALIGERLSRIDEKARELLPWAAALGRSFDPELLGSITGLPGAPLLSALDDLERRGILKVSAADGEQGYDFTHDLIRQAAYGQTSAPRRRLIHGQIARALQALPDPGDARAGAVAHHAALASEHALAAAACAAACERCLRLFARSEAADTAGRGLLHLEKATALPPLERLKVELRLRSAQFFSGRRPERSRDSAALTRLAEEAEAAGLHAEAAWALRVLSEVMVDDPAAASTTMQRAVEVSRHIGPDATAAWAANTARCLVMIEHDVSRAKEMMAKLEAMPDLGDARPEFVFGQGLLAAHLGRSATAVEYLEESAGRFDALQDRWRQCESLARLVMVELDAGRPAEALRRCETLLPVASRLSEGSERPYAEALVSLCGLLSGEVNADAQVQAAVEKLRELDSHVHISWVLNQAALQALKMGNPAMAVAHARKALTSALKVGRRGAQVLARAVLAEAASALGDARTAEEHLSAGLRELVAPEDLPARAQEAIRHAQDRLHSVPPSHSS